MKIRSFPGTLLAGFLLIAAGAFGFSYGYGLLFDPAGIVDGSEPATLDGEAARYGRECFYPFVSSLREPEILEDGDRAVFFDLFQIHPDVYGPLLAWAFLTQEEMEAAVITRYEYPEENEAAAEYRLREVFLLSFPSEAPGGGSPCREEILLLINEDGMPLLFLRRGAEETADAEGSGGGLSEAFDGPDAGAGETVCRSVSSEEVPSEWFSFLSGLEPAWDALPFYHLLVREIQAGMPAEEGEASPGSLAEYAHAGEWQVCSDARLDAYICVVAEQNVILYYDREEGRFCGYSLALNRFDE